MLSNKLMGGVTAGEDAAEGVDLDGVNDYLSKSGGLGVAIKQITFSGWVYNAGTNLQLLVGHNNTYNADFVNVLSNSNGTLTINFGGSDGGGSNAVSVAKTNAISMNTWTHILISFDAALTTGRLYINDIYTAITVTNVNVNVNDIDTSYVGRTFSGINGKGRLSHVFLDYTYRDLSIEANRRLFITADGKPTTTATLKALNPILYLPMKDAATAHINSGTGGNFTLNGVIARSGRGPNQFNAPYSDLDGAADYLSRTTALNGATAGNAFTFACCFNWDGTSGQKLFEINAPPNIRFHVEMDGGSPSKLVIAGETSAGVAGINASLSTFAIAVGRNYVLVVSCDLSNTANRRITLNGVAQFVTWTTYTNVSIAFNSSNQYVGAQNGGTSLWNGRLGELYFDTKYIDLSNPDNLAKFVTGTGIDAKPADLGANGELPFGTPPLIYLPMYGDNAGKNYGTGGDFTVNSGPYTGARGPNEFWENKADFDGSTGYLARTSALVGVSDSKTFSCSFWFQLDTNLNNTFFLNIGTSAPDYRLRIERNSSTGQLMLYASNAAGTLILNATGSTNLSTGTGYYIQICIDQADVNKCKVYVNGVLESATWTTVTNDTIDIDLPIVNISAFWNGSTWGNFMDGKLSEFYFTTTYIDFSQEANRLKFRDAFGNPVALLPQIEAGTLPNPAIYMRFDPANFGKNLGTGGGFTINGTITDGGQL